MVALVARKRRPRDLFGNLIRPPREELIQRAIVEWLKIAAHPDCLWLHIPNGALERPSQRMRFAKLGALSGAADFLFVLPDKGVAFAEVKSELGVQSEAQQAFQARCAVLKLRYAIVRSVEDMRDRLNEWGGTRR